MWHKHKTELSCLPYPAIPCESIYLYRFAASKKKWFTHAHTSRTNCVSAFCLLPKSCSSFIFEIPITFCPVAYATHRHTQQLHIVRATVFGHALFLRLPHISVFSRYFLLFLVCPMPWRVAHSSAAQVPTFIKWL